LYIRDAGGFALAPADVVFNHVRGLLAQTFRPGAPVLDRPELVETFLAAHLARREREVFAMILLDSQNRLIEYVELFQGTLDRAEIHTREVVKLALGHNAACVIFAHNHCSGCSQPSSADVAVTRRLKTALSMVDIRVIDHFVVGRTISSLEQRGLLI